MSDLKDILDGNDEQPAEAPQEPEATEQPQEAETQPDGPARGPDGKFAAKGDKEDAPPASDEKAKGLEAGIAAERKKRQEWEDRYKSDVESLRQQIADMQAGLQSKPKEQTPPPSIWEDEQGTFQHYGQQITSQAVQQATYQSKLQMSEMMAQQAHDDFGEVREKLVEFVGSNPALNQQIMESRHPWEEAYKAYKNFTTMQELGATDIDSLKAQLMEQLKAEQEAAQARPNLPQSLAGEQSSRGSSATPQSPPSLGDILKG